MQQDVVQGQRAALAHRLAAEAQLIVQPLRQQPRPRRQAAALEAAAQQFGLAPQPGLQLAGGRREGPHHLSHQHGALQQGHRPPGVARAQVQVAEAAQDGTDLQQTEEATGPRTQARIGILGARRQRLAGGLAAALQPFAGRTRHLRVAVGEQAHRRGQGLGGGRVMLLRGRRAL